jgi:hypothetical protein
MELSERKGCQHDRGLREDCQHIEEKEGLGND